MKEQKMKRQKGLGMAAFVFAILLVLALPGVLAFDTYINNTNIFVDNFLGVGTSSPSTSAILEVNSTTKGFLPPRMTTAQMNAISSPATGMVVYNTNYTQLFVYDGSSWVDVEPGGRDVGNPITSHKDYVPDHISWRWVKINATTSARYLPVRRFNGQNYVAIGRGRTWGTAWSNAGVNSATLNSVHDMEATDAFTAAYLSQTQVQELANSRVPNNWGADGLILQRAAVNVTLTGNESNDWQFYKITSSETSAFSWDFATANTFDIANSSWSTSAIGAAGTNGTGDLRDYQPANDYTRIFTWNWTGPNTHQGHIGFSYGQSVTNGCSAATCYMWENATEEHPIPHTIVWMKLGFD